MSAAHPRRDAFFGFVFAAAFVCASLSPVSAWAQEKNVLRATLPNGLKVIIVHNNLAPVVSTSVNYLVGSDEAPAGFPGTAHAQEHMMFRGSLGLSADQLADIGSIMGGNFNADTRESITQYLFTVPSEDIDVALHIEATRMQDVTDSQKDWDLERGAIEQEVAQDLSNPGYVLYAKLRSILFSGTPYEHDALGTRPSFDKTTAAMLKNFHDAWYAPNNAILVVVGDVDPPAALAKIKNLFGPIKAKQLPMRPGVTLKPVEATSFETNTDRPTGTLMLAMRMVGVDSPDFAALEALSDVLSNHRFDLFGLVPQGKALDASFSLDPLPKAGLGFATVSFATGQDAKALERDVRAILAKVRTDGVPAELVEAAKFEERRQDEFQKNSIQELASVWSDAVALYGLNSPDDDLARIEKVTVADVNRVAAKYLDLDHAVTAIMNPQGSGPPVAGGGGFGGQENISLGEAKAPKLPDWAEADLNHLTVPPTTLHPVVSTLPNGLTLIIQPEDVSDTISVYGHIENRPETEEAIGKEGVSEVVGQLFAYGTEHLDRLAFQAALDQIGAEETAGTDFVVRALAQNFDRGVALLADNELHPALPQRAMEIVKDETARVVGARRKSPQYLTQRSLREALFAPEDPSLREATPETISSLTMADLREYYAHAFRPDMTSIIVIGHIAPDAARATIEKYFGGWSATGPKPNVDLPVPPNNKAKTIVVPDASRSQDNVILAEDLGFSRGNPGYYAIALGNEVLGGGFYSTRLSIDLRKYAGLVYSVGSQVQAGRTRSIYYIQYACDPENVGKAAAAVARELTNMQNALVTDDELARAKALLLRQVPLNEASIDDIARVMIQERELNLPLDEPTIAARHYIDLTPADVQAAFKAWLRPEALVRVSEGPTP